MNNSELLAHIKSKVSRVNEIPPSGAAIPNGNSHANGAKIIRDPFLYISCPASHWFECAKALKSDEKLSFDFLVMLTAVDHLKSPSSPARIEVVYHFYSMKQRHKLVAKVSLPREKAVIDSVVSLWKGADWQEREVYDMFGVKFEGHPNCSRILMWDEFPGHPLRKDFVHVPDKYDD